MLLDATPPRYANFNEEFNKVIDEGVRAERSQQTPRDYLGGSRLGHECERALGYEYAKTPKDEGRDFSGRIYRIFDRGHDGEARMVEYLKLAGFELEEEKPSGGQWGFATCYDKVNGVYRIRGHADGVIRGGPDKIGTRDIKKKYPFLWENKILNEKRYNALMKSGSARTSEWEYFVQTQIYMAYLELKWCLFTAVSANTMHIYAELIELDIAVAQEASDRGVRVVTAGRIEELPRIASKETDFRCKWCDYKETCWNTGAPEPQDQGVSLDWIAKNWGG